MNQYQYNSNRKPAVRLSRSKVVSFLQCPRCFYLDVKLGVKKPSWPPWRLNTAVDELLKKEFDIHRANKKSHPLMKEYNIKAVPFKHEKMDKWRENFQGIEYYDKDLNIEFSGAVDDLWKDNEGKLIVVDYKASYSNKEFDLENIYKRWYKKQVEFYQWLLREKNFNVSNTTYFVYANVKGDKKAFDKKLEFDVEVIKHIGDDSWVKPTLEDIKKTLESDNIPKPGPGVDDKGCEYCEYVEKANKVV